MRVRGRAVQIDPVTPTLKAPGTKRLKPEHVELLSSFAFNSNLRRYIVASSQGIKAVLAEWDVSRTDALVLKIESMKLDRANAIIDLRKEEVKAVGEGVVAKEETHRRAAERLRAGAYTRPPLSST